MLRIFLHTGVKINAFLQVVPQILVRLVQIDILLPFKHYLTFQLKVFFQQKVHPTESLADFIVDVEFFWLLELGIVMSVLFVRIVRWSLHLAHTALSGSFVSS
jgi:hypothetical protein